MDSQPDSLDASRAAEPTAATLVARLFVVPALIVCVLLGVALVVVFFGSSAVERRDSITDLIARIERDAGDRSFGTMLFPAARESWQAAQELAWRLERRDEFLKPEEIEPASNKLISVLKRFEPGRDVEEPASAQQYFLMMALARLGSASAVEPLLALTADPNWQTRRTALQCLAEMHGVDAARQAVPRVLPLLADRRSEVRMVACAAIAGLASSGDAPAIAAVAALLEGPSEVQWNAAMTLARLGSGRGKWVLMNMLDRGYWEGLQLDYQDSGATVRRPLSDNEIANNLQSAIATASNLPDAELQSLIAKLCSDKAVAVREAARKAAGRAPGPTSALSRPAYWQEVG